jgi:hypothetical protein
VIVRIAIDRRNGAYLFRRDLRESPSHGGFAIGGWRLWHREDVRQCVGDVACRIGGHWLTTTAYFVPVVAVLVWLIVTQARERRHRGEDR